MLSSVRLAVYIPDANEELVIVSSLSNPEMALLLETLTDREIPKEEKDTLLAITPEFKKYPDA